jgi:prepilin-type N-terminal cleavage/methylation domain-containing protein/prepilin-type processing-associated H-X9-DG protein
MKRRAFTLIELLVVIAIIAILAAILFPVFARAKESAKQISAVAQARQLSASVMMYAADYDDYFVPSAIRLPGGGNPTIWPPLIYPYVKNDKLFVAPGTDAKMSQDWGTRSSQNIGYNEATGVDLTSTGCTEGQASTLGCEGFTSPANFGQAEEVGVTPLFTTTPHGALASKYRSYVFSPYNGPSHPTDRKLGTPLVSDRDLVLELSSLSPGQLKPVRTLYFRDNKDGGRSPIVFADGHTKSYSASGIKAMNQLHWRFR